MKRLVYIITLLLLQTLSINLFAGERTKEEMKVAALNALSKNSKARGKTTTTQTSDLKVYVAMKKLSVIGSDDLGFAVVTSDDRFDEVIGYSSSNFSDGIPCGFRWWMETVEKAMEVSKGQTKRTRSRSGDDDIKSSVEPLMTTKWGQSNPFNAYLDYTISGKHYTFITGCVATAMAQVIKYHRYPEKSNGSISYIVWNYMAKMEHTFGTTYDYDNMLDEYNYQEWGSRRTSTEAVAKLMQDCGMAVKMNYGTEKQGSGARSSEIPVGLKTYFAYSDKTALYHRSDYSNIEWMQMIYKELSAGRPIIYSGVDKTDEDNPAGHAFVLHGYNTSGLVYVNWGWKGYYDGYYNIDLMNPDTNTFSSDQDMVFAIPSNGQIAETEQYNLNISVSANGYVSYNGNNIRNKSSDFCLEEGSTATLTFNPDEGYQIKSVNVNGVDVTSQVYNSSYTISKISQNTTVSIVFEVIPILSYTLSISAEGNGFVSYGDNTIRSITSSYNLDEDCSAILILSPDDGYQIKSVTVNGIDVTAQVYNNSYTINRISQNTTISVVFEVIPIVSYTLSISAEGDGSVSYNGNTIRGITSSYDLNEGSSVILTFTPDDGCQIKSVTVNGIDVTSQVYNSSYTISSLSQNTAVTIVFETIPVTNYTITISATGSGSVFYSTNFIRGNSSSFIIDKGGSAILTIAPDDGYKIFSMTINGFDVTAQVADNVYTIALVST